MVARDHSWQLDVLGLDGTTIDDDLRRRDFSINAIAAPLPLRPGEYVDPFGGLRDLQRRTLRMVAPDAFERDPLRTLRLARLACELDLAVDPETLRRAADAAPGLQRAAPERVFAELKRVISAPRPLAGLELMDASGATAAVLPELVALDGVEQSRFHHLDVHGHTRAVLAETVELERDPSRLEVSDDVLAGVQRLLQAPLANELTRGQALRFGALLHDIAKPQTRGVTAQGRITFMGHDEAGAQMASDILGRLRASDRLREHVAALTRHHLRLGFLVHEMPLGRRTVYDYLRDRGARGGRRDRAERRRPAGHARRQRRAARSSSISRWRASCCPRHSPGRPIRHVRPSAATTSPGALGIKPGPVIGSLLAELEAARFSGEVQTREEAIEHARQLIARRG